MSLEELRRDPMWLNKRMEFEHVIQVHEDGTVTDAGGQYAPEVYDGELYEPDGWSFFTTGYSGQYGHSGPWMHSSEFIYGRLVGAILSNPGYYVAIVHDDEDANEWAVVFKEAPASL